jgi:hypothetical protein
MKNNAFALYRFVGQSKPQNDKAQRQRYNKIMD